MKKILITTDFSENAWNAIFTALKVYANVECHFHILHAYEPNALNLLGPKSQQRLGVIYDSLSTYSEQELQEILTYLEINHLNPDHKFTSISKPETLVEAVKSIVAEKDIDILIMGTQGATGAKEVFLGSNTVKILKIIKDIPIFAIPAGFNFQKLKTIIFSTDFTKPYKKNELEQTIELASIWKAQIEIVHVAIEFNLNDDQKSNKTVLKQRLAGLDYHFKDIPFEISISHSLENYVANKDSSILGIIRHQHTFWEKVIGEAIVKKVAFHSHIPVLFLPQ
ncbi:universal stress protein [Maribacter sp. ACAM166]|uniref:universal stress protein n=1 Tax=Maribacter sp. ACAM166 TaxID=2508996 RepID=UPI0010FF1C64|nr:universal stress protein [Maribacter sp. ACAM166]TLP71132.1 universal stress protein [Maribacter sp. ACAM166]